MEISSNSVLELCEKIHSGNTDYDFIKNTLVELGNQKRWPEMWEISHALKVEISWIKDSKNDVWVDIGTAGEVTLNPPIGAQLPFQLWVHTHPWNAYWSITDLGTLEKFCGLIQEALVLGHDHCKRTECKLPFGHSLETGVEPLSAWTDEPCIPYEVSK